MKNLDLTKLSKQKLDILIDGVVVETENFNSTSSLTGTINHVFE